MQRISNPYPYLSREFIDLSSALLLIVDGHLINTVHILRNAVGRLVILAGRILEQPEKVYILGTK